ncbi:MAG: YeeE/YedE family protein [Ignavibacteriae bacterium]|nr:YeeE/YedE family protein [Ignavibacteriota bacterium]MCB9257757.1 YeeE/YedE family protein [Ignavibacteriales bacterium]
MGPLVPDIISNDLNFIVALVIGVAFGAILEQAGFSTSKKLVGLFYGYDFTVLRVFFTAGLVAMFGTIMLDHWGYLDINLIYINPLFVGAAIAGGLIMGLGFVIGGFCPGTSVCAAAIGKIDAMYFILGSVIGILLFAEGYPLWEEFYNSYSFGSVRIFNTLGISQSVFAFILTSIALFAFWATSIIENKVNNIKKPAIRFTPYYLGLTAVGIFIAFAAFMFPPRKAGLIELVKNEEFVKSYQLKEISSDELAYRIIEKDKKLQIFDFRTFEEYKNLNLPNSISFTIDNFFEKEPNKLLTLRHRSNVFITNDEMTERRIAIIASELGYNNIEILKGGLIEFTENILGFDQSSVPQNKIETTTFEFRKKASTIIPEMIKNNKPAGKVEKKQKRVVGGC